MGEEKRELIVRIQRGETHKGAKPVVEMWNENPRLEFPELRLFDLHKLFEVGIDPNQLAEGEELITRFWVYYEDSDRLNKNSNPYKDVTRLEAIAPPKSTAQQTLDAMLAALRQIDQRLAVACGLLETLVEGEELDLQRWAHDAFALALPAKILCRPDCRGLCTTCGADLNADPEHEHEAAIDPRWAKLGELKLD